MRTLLFSRQKGTLRNHQTVGTGILGRANVQESDAQYLLQVAVPGIRGEDITLTAVGSRLDISGKRQASAPENAEPAGAENAAGARERSKKRGKTQKENAAR